MDLWMDPLGDPLTTRSIQMGWGFTMEQYPSGQFGFIDNPDRPFRNCLVWTWTRINGVEPLLTPLPAGWGACEITQYGSGSSEATEPTRMIAFFCAWSTRKGPSLYN
jgi:hypothetical protein